MEAHNRPQKGKQATEREERSHSQKASNEFGREKGNKRHDTTKTAQRKGAKRKHNAKVHVFSAKKKNEANAHRETHTQQGSQIDFQNGCSVARSFGSFSAVLLAYF